MQTSWESSSLPPQEAQWLSITPVQHKKYKRKIENAITHY
jgi:hypothetical protein